MSYDVRLHAPDAQRTAVLREAVERVMERKLIARGIQHASVSAVPLNDSEATVRITLPSSSAVQVVKEIVNAPFAFELRAEKVSAPDPTKVAHENWIPTNLTGSSVLWTQATGDRSNGAISLTFELNEEGKRRFAAIVKKQGGKAIGLFVRDTLVSKMIIEGRGIPTEIVISGVPSASIAEVVMDDVNVGLLTSFKPTVE